MNHGTGRDKRSDSSEARSEAFDLIAEGEIQPPEHVKLRAGDLPFWRDIMRTRAKQVWSAVDLLHAANLTRTLADIEKLQGNSSKAEDKIDTLSRRAMNLSRLLGLTPRSASTNAARDGRNAKAAEEEAEAALDAVDDDDGLIPMMPRHLQ